MVKLTPPPSGVQDKTVYDYLYQLQEYLGMVLDGISDPGGIIAAAGQISEKAASKAASTEIYQQVQYLKALIIKTATEVEEHTAIDLSGLKALIEELGEIIEGDNGLRVQLLAIQNDYLARSEFGTYSESVAQILDATAQALTQYVKYDSELIANLQNADADFERWRVESEGYIRSGVVDYREDTTPVIGIAIGQNLTVLQDANGDDVTETVNGVDYKVVEQKGFRAIYAADELSFWVNDAKVAYMSNQQLCITDVAALSHLAVGEWDFQDGANGLVIKWGGD